MSGPGVAALEELGEVILDPWIDHQPAAPLRRASSWPRGPPRSAPRSSSARPTSARARCSTSRCVAIGSTRGDPTNVDLAGATAKGIPVLRAPGRNADGVAELTVGLLLAVTRHLLAADRDVRAGEVFRDGTIPYQRFRAWQLAGPHRRARRPRRRRAGPPGGGSRASACG